MNLGHSTLARPERGGSSSSSSSTLVTSSPAGGDVVGERARRHGDRPVDAAAAMKGAAAIGRRYGCTCPVGKDGGEHVVGSADGVVFRLKLGGEWRFIMYDGPEFYISVCCKVWVSILREKRSFVFLFVGITI